MHMKRNLECLLMLKVRLISKRFYFEEIRHTTVLLPTVRFKWIAYGFINLLELLSKLVR